MKSFVILSREATCEASGQWTCHTNQHNSQQSTHQQTNPWLRFNENTVQRYDNTNNRYLDIKYVSERIGNSWISAPNYLNTNSVVTACFLPSLPLTGDACSVPDTECSIFLNFPNCLIFYVSNCLILQPPLPPLPFQSQ